MSYRDKISGIGIISKNKEQLPYGNKSRGKLISPEKGRRAIFVPSFGVLEREEVDYIVEAEQEKEDERIQKNVKSEKKKNMENFANAVRQASSGERAKTAEEILKEVSSA